MSQPGASNMTGGYSPLKPLGVRRGGRAKLRAVQSVSAHETQAKEKVVIWVIYDAEANPQSRGVSVIHFGQPEPHPRNPSRCQRLARSRSPRLTRRATPRFRLATRRGGYFGRTAFYYGRAVEWKVSSLRVPSTIRFSRLDCLEQTLLLYRLGSITDVDGKPLKVVWDQHIKPQF